MKQTTLIFIILFILLPIIVIEARGGRGRGGLGGLFGKWKKTKSRPTNSRNSGSSVIKTLPMQSTITKQKPSKTRQHDLLYPRPQNGNKGYKTVGYYDQFKNSPKYNGHHTYNQYLPPGATHYATHSAIPTGAVYVPHTPPSAASSDIFDFLKGYMVGRLLSISTHAYQQHEYHRPQQHSSQNSGHNIIIIENGTLANETKLNFWPMDGDVPPFNSSLSSEKAVLEDPLFKRVTDQVAATEENNTSTYQSSPNGIICMPMLFNETDSSDNNKVMQVEKLVCFPAPPPPPQTIQEPNCVMRYFVESNPKNPSETITVPRKHCHPTSTERSEPVVGDIIDDLDSNFKESSDILSLS